MSMWALQGSRRASTTSRVGSSSLLKLAIPSNGVNTAVSGGGRSASSSVVPRAVCAAVRPEHSSRSPVVTSRRSYSASATPSSSGAIGPMKLNWHRVADWREPISGHHLLSLPQGVTLAESMFRATDSPAKFAQSFLMLTAAGKLFALRFSAIGVESAELKVKGPGLRGSQVVQQGDLVWLFQAAGKGPSVMAAGSVTRLSLSTGEATKPKLPGACPLQTYRVAVVGESLYAFGEDYHDQITDGPLSVMKCTPSEGKGWEKLSVSGDLPPRRKEVSIASVGHEIFVLLKATEDEVLETYIFNTNSNEWTFGEVAGEPPQSVTHGTLTPMKVNGVDKLLLVGGTLFFENLLMRTVTNNVAVLDTNSLTWQQIHRGGIEPVASTNHAALVVNDGHVLVSGGKDEVDSFAHYLVYDLTQE